MTQLASPFDDRIEIITAYQEARSLFETFAATDAPELPGDDIDAMQVELTRWQTKNFGLQTDERIALGVIEEITENALAAGEHDTREAIDGLGDVCVYASQLATNNRLAFRPILHLVEFWLSEELLSPTMGGVAQLRTAIYNSQGVLAQVVLKRAQKIRGYENDQKYRTHLVGALAGSVAMAAWITESLLGEGCEIEDVFLTIGERVARRGTGHEAIPKLSVH